MAELSFPAIRQLPSGLFLSDTRGPITATLLLALIYPLQAAAVSINVPKNWQNQQREGSPVRDVE